MSGDFGSVGGIGEVVVFLGCVGFFCGSELLVFSCSLVVGCVLRSFWVVFWLVGGLKFGDVV